MLARARLFPLTRNVRLCRAPVPGYGEARSAPHTHFCDVSSTPLVRKNGPPPSAASKAGWTHAQSTNLHFLSSEKHSLLKNGTRRDHGHAKCTWEQSAARPGPETDSRSGHRAACARASPTDTGEPHASAAFPQVHQGARRPAPRATQEPTSSARTWPTDATQRSSAPRAVASGVTVSKTSQKPQCLKT